MTWTTARPRSYPVVSVSATKAFVEHGQQADPSTDSFAWWTVGYHEVEAIREFGRNRVPLEGPMVDRGVDDPPSGEPKLFEISARPLYRRLIVLERDDYEGISVANAPSTTVVSPLPHSRTCQGRWMRTMVINASR
jgi:hypothetical protein